MWPLTNGAETFTSYLAGHGVETNPDACSLVGIDELEHIENVRVYPNPTSELVTIDLSSFSSPVTIQVIDMLGQVISTTASAGVTEEVDLSFLEAGQYIIRISNNQAEARATVSVID